MLAVDTNVLVRFLTGDDAQQAKRALALFRDAQVWIAKTVLLETEWVLRSLYGFESDRAAPALQALVGLENVHLEDARAVQRALGWFAAGLDLADALHLASLDRAEAFVTFDANFRKRAARVTGVPVRAL
jgi:predicted nucleic-acid-binding protein